MPTFCRTIDTLSLRRATAEDVALIQELADRIWTSSYADLLSIEQRQYMLRWMYAAHKLASEIGRGVVYEIADFAAAPVGFLAWELLSGSQTAHLHKLYLAPQVQGRGWGQALLRHVEAAALARGARLLELRVNKGNLKARRAYERAGLHIAEAIVTDIGGGYAMDDYVMRKPLTASPGTTRSGTDSPPSG